MYKTEQEVREVISLGKQEEVINVFLESYLQGIEFTKWSIDKDLEVDTYEPIDVSEQMTQWKIDNYILLREPLYPKLEIFADAWVKQDNKALEEYRQNCLNVKELYPKVKHGTETV